VKVDALKISPKVGKEPIAGGKAANQQNRLE
jgi:hypothetical protein